MRNSTSADIEKAATAVKTAASSVARDGVNAANDLAETVIDEAGSTATRLKNKASDIASDVKDRAGDIAADVRDRASDALLYASDVAGDKVNAAKDTLAGEGHRLAGTLRSAAADRGASVQGRMLDSVAGGVETVADGLQNRTIGEMVADTQAFARRNPGLVMAGAAVLGFALVRFLRSGAQAPARVRRS